MAKILINGSLSKRFQITRGTRQGCPLSPHLFNLYIEPLDNTLRKSQGIIPFQFKGWVRKVALYADDLMIYTSDLDSSLPFITRILMDFGNISVPNQPPKDQDNVLEYGHNKSRTKN